MRELFDRALEQPAADRTLFLREACAEDPALLDEVRKLLRLHGEDDSLLEKSAVKFTPAKAGEARKNNLTGRRVGAYELQEEIGRGGMGAVYRAVRVDDTFRKTVAIKVVGGLADAHVESRFRKERDILARLEHPNIARILDGGTTEEGLLFLVMELVDGERIDQYSNRRNLDIPSRLGLFRDVCSAVAYAHRNLIVHRDLKPSNILVTPDGRVKLLDFGIAKVLTESGTEIEQTATLRMTPDYASPEQIRGEPITTVSDIYSLGVVLFELLTGGASVYAHTGKPLHERLRAICDEEPLPPSKATTDLCQDPKVRRKLEGELDNIALKALAKRPADRYASVDQLEADVRRYLDGRPVLAQRQTWTYRAGKYLRRNRFAAAAVGAILLAVGSGVATTWYQVREAIRQRELAVRRYNDVRSLSTTILFDVHDSIRDLPGAGPARRTMVAKSLEILERLSRDSEGDPALQRELAAAYDRAADIQAQLAQGVEGARAALPVYQKALELRRRAALTQPDTPAERTDMMQSWTRLAAAQLQMTDAGAAEASLAEAQRLSQLADPGQRLTPGWQRAEGLLQFHGANVAAARGRLSESKAGCEAAIRYLEPIPNRLDDLDVTVALAQAHALHGHVLRLSRQSAQALPHFDAATEILKTFLQRHPNNIAALRTLAKVQTYRLMALGGLSDRDTVLRGFAEVEQLLLGVLGTNPDDSLAIRSLAFAYSKEAQLRQLTGSDRVRAEAAWRNAWRYFSQLVQQPQSGALDLNDYADALIQCALPAVRNDALALELATKAVELTGGRSPGPLDTLAWAYFRNGHREQARATIQRALQAAGMQDSPLRQAIVASQQRMFPE
jgi:serine/threonine protein kinase